MIKNWPRLSNLQSKTDLKKTEAIEELLPSETKSETSIQPATEKIQWAKKMFSIVHLMV